MGKSRVELHLHTHYSLMDGLNTAEEYVEVAKQFEMPAIALTDHGTLSGHREMQRACKDAGIKPILGVEAYISPTDRFDRRSVKKRDDNTQNYHHIILHAKDEEGLKNLHNMSREAWISGFYSKPRVDWELLDQYGEGIIVLSGCMNGLIPKAFERGGLEEAERIAAQYKERFGDDFYMEVQPHNPPELNAYLLELADKHKIKPVATNDCHFTRPELRWVEESLLILSTNPKQNNDATYDKTKHIENIFDRFREMYPERPISFEEIDVYLMSREEAANGFAEQGVTREDIFDNTFEVADKIGEYDYRENEDFLPRESSSPNDDLRKAVFEGLDMLGLTSAEYTKRAEEEMEIIANKNFSPYFLIVADMVREAKDRNIFVGPGRGSAAGSLVCYALGITEVDPIKWSLLFFRFIDESREDWPDIDVDFEKSRRGEVKEYLREKYGYVASISNFIYFSGKGVVRDAARVYSVPIPEVNKALKQVEKWDDFLTTGAEDTVKFRNKYPEVIDLAEHLRGRIRSVGMHAAGVVTSSVPIEDYAPFETRSDPNDKVSGRVPVVAWDMKECEQVGLIKLDVLGLNTLDVIHDTLDFVKSRHGKDIDLRKISLDDQRVYRQFHEGHTAGIFQADGATNREFLMRIEPTEFEDLVAATSLARPGAMNTVGDVYLKRKHGKEKVEYVHDVVRPFLEDTYGTVVYQEQVMLAATELGGMSRSDSNNLRKIIGKKRDAKEFEQYRDRFIEGASEKISVEKAEKLWHDFEAHAGYSFNRSHAVAYSFLTYQSMWLKTHYPLEFMAAAFRNEDKKEKRVSLLLEMRRLGLRLKLPHVNLSEAQAIIVDDYIRLGLTDIKYISDMVYRNIEKHGPYESYAHLREEADRKGSGINTRALAALRSVNAVPFDDNPEKGLDVSDNLFEYMDIPRFKGRELPEIVANKLTEIQDYTEDETHVVKGLVMSLKRGKTKAGKEWVRAEIVDETGKAGVFCDPAHTPEEGQMYVMLITWNRIMKAIPIDDFHEDNNAAFVQFMYNKGESAHVGTVRILAVERRFTAKRQLMATLVVANHEDEMRRVLVFPKNFGKYAGKLKEGTVHRVDLKKLDDGSLMLREVK